MPILVVDRRNKECPTVVCDHCGKPIDNAKQGNAEWRYEDPGKIQAVAVYFTHKACSDAFEHAQGKPGTWHTNDLDVFLLYLCNGVKLDTKGAHSKASMLDSLGF